MPKTLSYMRLILFFVLAGVSLAPSEAWSNGVLVRLKTDRTVEDPVLVELAADGSETNRVELRDDGKQPDVTAGDGLWAGALSLPHSSVAVTLVLGEDLFDGGTVEWSATDTPRDIDLNLRGNELTAIGREANVHGAGNEPGPNAPRSDGGVGGAMPTPDAAAPVEVGASTTSSAVLQDSASSGPLFVGAGVLILVVFAGLIMQRRARRRFRRGDLTGVEFHPPGGFAGPDSPPLDDGLVYWQVSPDERARVVGVLTRMLARHHNVLLVGADGAACIGDSGQNVFVSSTARPRKVGDALEVLHRMPMAPAVALFSAVEGSKDDWLDRDEELPLGTGGIVLCAADHSAPAPTHRAVLVGETSVRVTALDGEEDFLIRDRSAARMPSAPVW